MKRSYAGSMDSWGARKKSPTSTYYYESKQTGEEPLTRIRDLFTCRYAYGRAAESVKLSEKGQDFLAFSLNEDVCRFVLCDGVGLSYRGDVASRLLGQGLMEWLENQEELSSASLERKLKELSLEADRELRDLSVDSTTPMLLREVLEEKQRMGSEAMYICGRIELPTRFRRKGRLWLAWQGDSRVRLWHKQRELTSLFGDHFRTAERWSSRIGPVGGKPHVYSSRLDHESEYRLQLYSDGLNDLDAVMEHIPDEQVQVLMNALHTDGLEDDASFLEFMW
ncbi:PP2C family serine/threonine-protein phosphatase [Paenibacillus sp. Cedars]|uniref:PP2C family protein-serine/threonine phosphatase n=1 Tax=Paenibacillus TaxID=44249 RepID=UPI001164A4EE|nr:protein phosphatase 2C domain-containing protein [Paenibacillus sp. Cedars]AWP27020.1 hypothetical protein B9D94_10470 [Paenibacillus sp. Cedars]